MGTLRDDSGTSRDQGSLDNLERARLYFERKAGRPVSTAEAREWLDSLVEYLKTAQLWAREAAEREESERRFKDALQADRESTGISSVDAQQAGHEASGISSMDDQLAAREATGISCVDAQQADHEASGIFTIGDQQDDQASDPDIQLDNRVYDQDAPQTDQQDAREYSGISGRDNPGLPSPKASRRIAAHGRPRISGLNIPQDAPGISMNVRKNVQADRAARSGQE